MIYYLLTLKGQDFIFNKVLKGETYDHVDEQLVPYLYMESIVPEWEEITYSESLNYE